MDVGKVDGSIELISEMKALIASGNTLNALDEKKVRDVVAELTDSFDVMRSIENNPFADTTQPYYASSVHFYRSKCLRDKRSVMAYLLWRQGQITNAWWTAQDNTVRKHLSSAESTYLLEYNNLMVEYMTSFAIPVDLRAFLWRPPSAQQLEVRGLMNHVFVSPITGNTVSIYYGKQILLNFEDAESLIQQSVVELI